MKIISLTKGKEALVNDEDFEFLNVKGTWSSIQNPSGIWYAFRTDRINNFPYKEYMHRTIMQKVRPNFSGDVDHKDGNGLNNQRSNLRVATRSQNHMNRRPRQNCVSAYKGVTWHNKRGKWRARIVSFGEEIPLGFFDSEIKAAEAYDRAAERQFGKFAKLNFERS